MSARAFQLYCVNAQRTGVFVLRDIFRDYRFLRDFQLEKAEEMLRAARAGRLAKGELARYIRRRDRDGLLEADCSHIHAGWIDLLPGLFPESKYLLTIRNCYAWLDATLNQLLDAAWEPGTRRRLSSRRLGPEGLTLFDAFRGPDELARHLGLVVDRYFAEWADTNQRLLDHIPPERSLVVPVDRVGDIQPRVPDIARLVGVPVESLAAGLKPPAPPPRGHGVLGRVEPSLIEDARRRRTQGLMDRFFPGRSLRDFLAAPAEAG